MKLREIKMGPHYVGYGEGAEPGIRCEIELQVGERYGSVVNITLTPEETKQVVAQAVNMALSHLTFDLESIDVTGKPGVPRTAPEFASHEGVVAMEPL